VKRRLFPLRAWLGWPRGALLRRRQLAYGRCQQSRNTSTTDRSRPTPWAINAALAYRTGGAGVLGTTGAAVAREDARAPRESSYEVYCTQNWSKASVRDLAISAASRFSIWCRCNMNTGLPSRNRATDGEEGG
jgi:hypothetical protein